MGDYNGPERREHHCPIGQERFIRLEQDVHATREKVFNGLSGLPRTIMWGFGIIISLLVSIAAIAGSTRAKTAEVEQKLLDHIEWGFTENARNQIERNELEDAIDELKEALNDYPRDD